MKVSPRCGHGRTQSCELSVNHELCSFREGSCMVQAFLTAADFRRTETVTKLLPESCLKLAMNLPARLNHKTQQQ